MALWLYISNFTTFLKHTKITVKQLKKEKRNKPTGMGRIGEETTQKYFGIWRGDELVVTA